MSHAATNWAIRQRGLKPAAKVVLWHLCDRYNPDYGCFPDQVTLAHDCEMSRSSLNNQLEVLEATGLIVRERRLDKRTRKQESTRYRFPFEDDFPRPNIGHGCDRETVEPSPDSGHGPEPETAEPSPESGLGAEPEPESKKDPNPSPKNRESRVQILDSHPVREPVIEPVIEREGARASPDGDETEALTASQRRDLFTRTYKSWFAKTDSSRKAQDEWDKLTDAERRVAAERAGEWQRLWLDEGRKYRPAFSTYLAERRWTSLPDKRPEASPTRVAAKPMGKLWIVRLIQILLAPPSSRMPVPTAFIQSQIDAGGERGAHLRRRHLAMHGWPAATAMLRNAAEGRGASVPTQLQPIADRCQACATAEALWAAWRVEFERRNWPWFDFEPPDYVWMPAAVDQDTDADSAQTVGKALAGLEVALQEISEREASEATPCKEGGKAAVEETGDDDRAS